MRTLFLLLFSFVQIGIFGQTNETDFVVKNAYYISIDIYSKNNYGIMFDVIMNQEDSLIVDTSNKQNFINGVLQNTTYVPRCWDSDVFRKIYGDTGIETKHNFSNMFFNEIEKKGRKDTLKLTSGEFVTVSYIKLKGIFVQLNKEISFSEGLTQEDNPKVSKPCIPFAITEYEPTRDMPIKNNGLK